MQTDNLKAYELIQEENITDVHAYGYILRHKKSGARVMVLENDDENKVFNIAFRTPPADSTGVAHIVEHTVLCGSKNFPLKDPFVELVKGSLNTFLNAMTYPDKTMYPVASCNDQDFKNLMHVYLDAVFYPNIYKKEEIFRQEGWNYQLEKPEDDLAYNGVVYSEMKGVFSSPEEYLDRVTFNALFPDTPYGVESGGDPDAIPELTYEQFLDFHCRYYHPSNSYIYLYGDMDMVERLEWMDREYLSHFDEQPVDSEIAYQQSFDQIKDITLPYPVGEDEPTEDNSYLSYNVVVSDALNKEECVAFEILEYALISAPGAPLKQVLLDEKIGKDIMGDYQDGLLQPFFTIVAKNARPEQKEKFVQLITDTLQSIVTNGIDQKAIRAGINYFEFRFREADFSSYPKGLMYGIDVFDSWLYDEKKPFIHLQQLEVFDDLKKKAGTGYFESLIERYFLKNTHGAVITINPEPGLAAKKEEALHKKLQEYKNSLSQEEIAELVCKTKRLKEYQEAPESVEALACIPMLKRSDIKKETLTLYNEEKEIQGIKILHHNLYTNGIGYLTLLFDTNYVPEELVPYMSVLKSVLGYIGTKNYTYGELFNEINANSGGIMCGIQVYNGNEDSPYRGMLGIKAKALYGDLGFLFDMITEILCTSDLTDEKRLYEIIAQMKSRMQMGMASAGHSTAAARATSYFSKVSYFQEQISGITFYQFINDLEVHFEERKEELIANLKLLIGMLINTNRMTVSYVADEEGYAYLEEKLPAFAESISGLAVECEDVKREIHPVRKNEGFKTAGQVQYVAKAGNFKQAGYEYTGALNILKTILGYDYLWNQVRVKGGAYGCMSNFKRQGDMFFVSYRDPNLKNTVEVFDKTADYIAGFQADDHEMTKYIIGTISGLDTPMTPATKGNVSLAAYFNGITRQMLQQERDQILEATQEDIKALAPYVKAAMEQNNLCVVGAETVIEKEKEMFMQVENLK